MDPLLKLFLFVGAAGALVFLIWAIDRILNTPDNPPPFDPLAPKTPPDVRPEGDDRPSVTPPLPPADDSNPRRYDIEP